MDIEALDDALAALHQMRRQVKGRRRGRWLAQCPAHDDNVPSLSVRAGERVGVLLHSHAGCTFEDILTVLRGEAAGRPQRLLGYKETPAHCSCYPVV